MKKKLLQYGISGIIGIVISVWVMDMEGLFYVSYPVKDTVLILCDSFFVPGILLALFGVLVWISCTGFFDVFGFVARTAIHTLLPFVNREHKSYYDYKMEKAEKRKGVPYFLLITGTVFLTISTVLLVVWAFI